MRKWLLVRIPLGFVLASIALVTLLRWVPVRYTPVMLKRAFQFRAEAPYRTEQEWVSLEEISPELINAVVLTEDQKFWQHKGFDWEQLGAMWKAHRQEGARIRGCSTLSQQTAKNVFTFGSRTLLRKGLVDGAHRAPLGQRAHPGSVPERGRNGARRLRRGGGGPGLLPLPRFRAGCAAGRRHRRLPAPSPQEHAPCPPPRRPCPPHPPPEPALSLGPFLCRLDSGITPQKKVFDYLCCQTYRR